MANPKILSRKQTSGEDKYCFCPFCKAELEKDGKDYKEFLQPLFKVVTATWDDVQKQEFIDMHYECPRCKKSDITTDTFFNFYCK